MQVICSVVDGKLVFFSIQRKVAIFDAVGNPAYYSTEACIVVCIVIGC